MKWGYPYFWKHPLSRKMDFSRCLAGYYCCCFEIKVALSKDLFGFSCLLQTSCPGSLELRMRHGKDDIFEMIWTHTKPNAFGKLGEDVSLLCHLYLLLWTNMDQFSTSRLKRKSGTQIAGRDVYIYSHGGFESQAAAIQPSSLAGMEPHPHMMNPHESSKKKL